MLRNLPSTLPSDGGNVNNGTAGVASLNLRGLGAQRNLILVDGKRLTPFNTAGVVDTSQIPTALLDRVDLVTGGASAVYGSDAMSGAINFLMKRNFEGVAVDYNNGQTGSNDGDKTSMALTLGTNLAEGKGNVALSVNYSNRDGVQLGQRPLGQLGIATANGAGLEDFRAGRGPTSAPAGCDGPGSVAAGGSTTTLPTRLAIVGVPAAFGTGPGTPGGNGGQFRNDGMLGTNCSVFNFNPFNYYETPQDRYGGSVFGRFEFNKNAEVYSRFLYSNTTVRQQVAPSGVFGNPFFVPLANPFLSDQAQMLLIQQGEAARAAGRLNAGNWRDENANNVVDEPDYLNFAIRRRTVEFGERSTTFKNDAYQFVLGTRGNIIGEWEYDLSYQRGQSNRTSILAGYSNVANIANALDSVDGTTCANGDSTCVPINLFGGFGSITPEMTRYSSATALSNETYIQQISSAVVNGSFNFLRPLATRPIGMVFGLERRREEGEFIPDECLKLAPTSCLGGAGGNSLPLAGGFQVSEAFTEAIVPLLDGLSFAKSLDLEVGYRWANYDPTGLNRTWKYGLGWTPVDGVLARVMRQRAARAPNVGELSAPQTTGLANAANDPCSVANPGAANDPVLRQRCIDTGVPASDVGQVEDIVSGQINGFFGTDLDNLPEPESADTTTIGVVFNPSSLGVLRNPYLSIDYYDIKINKVIGTFGAQEILDGCYGSGRASDCAKIVRVDGTLTAPGSGIELFTTNLKVLEAEGIEVAGSFGLPLGNFGRLRVAGNLNYYLTQEFQSSDANPVTVCKGFYGTTCGNPLPELRFTQRTTWEKNKFEVSALWRYIGKTEVEASQAVDGVTFAEFREIEAYNYFDLSFGYNFTKKIRASFLVTNVLEEEPPVLGNEIGTTASNSGNTFPSVYDPLGRSFTLGLSAAFN